MRVLSSSAHDFPMEDHDGGTMSLVLKILLGAVGALLAVSVATGVVAATGPGDPTPRETIVVDTASNDQGRTPEDDRDDTRDQGDDQDDADDDIESVRVEPDDLADAREDARDDRRDAREDRTDDRTDDSSGPGSGDDDSDDGDDDD